MPRPNIDFGKNKNCIPMKTPMAHVYTNKKKAKQDWYSDDYGLRKPVIQKQNSGKVLPLS